jgi:hypothetical protein
MQIAERAYDEMVDLLARGSSPRDVLDFRPSATAQNRARYLLEQNRLGQLTPEEAVEMKGLGKIEHLMQLVKARARLYTETTA